MYNNIYMYLKIMIHTTCTVGTIIFKLHNYTLKVHSKKPANPKKEEL